MNVDAEAIHSAIVRGLPLRARWAVKDTWLDYDFSAGHQGLRPLSPEDVTFEIDRPEWLELLIFGEYDFAEGGGANPFLGVRKADGTVWGLDVERDGDETFLLNSSIDHFIRAFSYLNGYLGAGSPLPSDAEAQLQAIDSLTYSGSEWQALVSYLAQEE